MYPSSRWASSTSDLKKIYVEALLPLFLNLFFFKTIRMLWAASMLLSRELSSTFSWVLLMKWVISLDMDSDWMKRYIWWWKTGHPWEISCKHSFLWLSSCFCIGFLSFLFPWAVCWLFPWLSEAKHWSGIWPSWATWKWKREYLPSNCKEISFQSAPRQPNRVINFKFWSLVHRDLVS